MMECHQCGWQCDCDETYIFIFSHTPECIRLHKNCHSAWELKEQEQDMEKRSYFSTSSSIFGPQRRIKRCQICEQEVGVIIHVCKKQEVALDYIDFLLLIDKKRLDELRRHE